MGLSHNQRMENQTQQTQVFTKAETVKGVVLSTKDAEEYRAFKRKKNVEEVMTAIARSSGTLLGEEDVQKVCERAVRLKQASVKLPLSKMPWIKPFLKGRKVRLDCMIGGNGETSVKVKAYETRVAIRSGAKEITVVIAPSMIRSARYGEIRRELRKIRAASKRVCMKVWADSEFPATTLGRLARMAGEIGANYFSVDYFAGCERLRFDLINGCKLEVSGVETLEDFKRLTALGVGRIVTDNVWEIYGDWMREAEKVEFGKPSAIESAVEKNQPQKSETVVSLPEVALKTQSKTEPQSEPKIEPKLDPPTVTPVQKTPLPVSKVEQANVLAEKEGVGAEEATTVTGRKPHRLEGSDLKFL